MAAQRQPPSHRASGDAAWIRHEFTVRGLVPPHCTPEALARALERERQITIVFQPHESDDPGVYGLLYRQEGDDSRYAILFRPTYSIVLQRLTLFHELAHLLFQHPFTEVAGVGSLRGYMVSDEDDALAEAFAVGAMQHSFLDAETPVPQPEMDDAAAPSAFSQFITRTGYWV